MGHLYYSQVTHLKGFLLACLGYTLLSAAKKLLEGALQEMA